MKLKDARDYYYTFTGSLSSVNRQLCFAGIAVVWVFAFKGDNGSHSLPETLFYPLGCFVLGLALDLCHYIVAASSWGIYQRYKEKAGIGEDEEFGAPRYINWTPNIFFWFKVVATLIGYGALLELFLA